MPVTYRIIEPLGLVVSQWRGDVTLEEARWHNASLRADPRFRPDMLQLSDARHCRSRITGDAVRSLARSSPFGPEAFRAMLVNDDDTFGVTRMYQAQATQAGSISIFRDRDEAILWLGLTPEQVPELDVTGGLTPEGPGSGAELDAG